jgi:hypothetical protein
MRLQLTLLMILSSICPLLCSDSWGATIMKDDGTSINCAIDGEQSITIKTSSGESLVVKLLDIFWMAGGDKKRIRLNSSRKDLIVGEIQQSEIKINKGGENTFISPRNIVLYWQGDVDLKNIGYLEIIEFADEVIVEKRSRSAKKLIIHLLPQNWEGNMQISNAKYSKKLSTRSDLDITFSIQGNNSLNKDRAIGFAAFLKGFERSGTSIQYYPFKEESEVLQAEGVARLLYLFHSPLDNDKIWGNGYIYFYLIPDPNPKSKSRIVERLGEGNLIIEKTLSNVLKLPISVEKEN